MPTLDSDNDYDDEKHSDGYVDVDDGVDVVGDYWKIFISTSILT